MEPQAPRSLVLTLHVVAAGPLPETPLQDRVGLRKKIAYGHVGAAYNDGAALVDARDAAAAQPAHVGSSQAASSGRDKLMAAQGPEAQAAAYLASVETTLNTAGLGHMTAVVKGWSLLPRLREVFNTKKAVQDELWVRVKLEEALFALDKHLSTLVHDPADGLLAYEVAIFNTGSVPRSWEVAYKARLTKFTNVLHDLPNSAKGETKLYPQINVGTVSGKVTAFMAEAAANGDREHCVKMAGVLATLNSWRAFVEHVIGRRMLSLLQAQRSKAKRIGTLQHQSAEYKAAVEKNLEEMATARDRMPPLPPLLRMIHMGYSSAGVEPEDENARIASRVADLSALIGERPEGFWARPAGAAARALAPPAS